MTDHEGSNNMNSFEQKFLKYFLPVLQYYTITILCQTLNIKLKEPRVIINQKPKSSFLSLNSNTVWTSWVILQLFFFFFNASLAIMKRDKFDFNFCCREIAFEDGKKAIAEISYSYARFDVCKSFELTLFSEKVSNVRICERLAQSMFVYIFIINLICCSHHKNISFISSNVVNDFHLLSISWIAV